MATVLCIMGETGKKEVNFVVFCRWISRVDSRDFSLLLVTFLGLDSSFIIKDYYCWIVTYFSDGDTRLAVSFCCWLS